MADRAQIGVRYCGGCNPRYDRVALVKRIEALFPEADFLPATPGAPYSAVLVVNGCPNRCADVTGFTVPQRHLIPLNGWEDLLPVRDALRQALEERVTQTLDHDQVLRILPHRPPMLLIDRVDSLIPGEEIIAFFFVPPDLPAFEGHFPGEPILPGIYTAEAAAQAAGLMLLTLERYAGKTPLLAGIQKANFRRPILPGDTMEIHAALLSQRPELGYITCRGQVFTAGALAADLELKLVMR